MGSNRFSKVMGRVAATCSLAFVAVAPAAADFDDALRAYSARNNGQVDPTKVAEAMDLWHKYANAGDVLSRQILGDLYSNQPIYVHSLTKGDFRIPLPEETGIIRDDKVQALAWYTIAATHDFDDYSQQPDFRMVNARQRARDRVPELKATMTTEQVLRAQEMVVTILSSQSAFDLYRLGRMYQAGNGLQKNNVEALKYYRLASSRARNANQNAMQQANLLVTLMSREEIDEADRLAREWQPPLPEVYNGQSPLLAEIENQQRALDNKRLALAIGEIEREFANKNEHVIQNSLAALGLYLGPIDGSVGPKTRQAIERFQYNLVEMDDTLTPEQKRDVMTGELTPMQKVALVGAAAEVNHPQSQYIFGIMHAEGIGVPVNGEQAVRWLKKSADFGYPLAHYALGRYYRKGIYGDDPVPPSRSEASFHLGQAAALGFDPAQKELTELYEFPYAQD
jgi:TPR repeat protein